MKICMYSVSDATVIQTGGGKRFIELKKALEREGYEVVVLQPSSSEGSKHSSKMVGLKSVFSNKNIFQEIRKGSFDRVIVFDIRAAISLVLNRIPNIYLFLRQDMIEYKKIQLQERKINRWFEWLYLNVASLMEFLCLLSAQKIVVQCHYDLQNLLLRHKTIRKAINQKSVIQINNVNPSWIVQCASNEPKEKYFDVAFVGNFRDNRKGHAPLLKALRAIISEGYPIRAAIVGDGKQLSEYQKQYADIEGIYFLGRIENPIKIIEESKLLVVPSYADSCPNTVMEGLYCGIPVIGADRGGIPEILNDDEWLFELDEAHIKLAIKNAFEGDKLQKMAADQEMRKRELTFDWGKKMTEIVCS